jgi:hypothetical protein
MESDRIGMFEAIGRLDLMPHVERPSWEGHAASYALDETTYVGLLSSMRHAVTEFMEEAARFDIYL